MSSGVVMVVDVVAASDAYCGQLDYMLTQRPPPRRRDLVISSAMAEREVILSKLIIIFVGSVRTTRYNSAGPPKFFTWTRRRDAEDFCSRSVKQGMAGMSLYTMLGGVKKRQMRSGNVSFTVIGRLKIRCLQQSSPGHCPSNNKNSSSNLVSKVCRYSANPL